MAATSLQSGNAVWQKVLKASAGMNPASAAAFKGLKEYFAQQLKNPDLQFIPFTASGAIAATGSAGPTGAVTLYGLYGKKNGTGSTAAFLEIHDKNTITGSTDVKASLWFKAANDENFLVAPRGIPLASTTGNCVVSVTAIGGSTVSTGASDSQDGFFIVGA